MFKSYPMDSESRNPERFNLPSTFSSRNIYIIEVFVFSVFAKIMLFFFSHMFFDNLGPVDRVSGQGKNGT